MNLVFLHGFMSSAEDWRGVVAHFHEETCLCIDLPFHGENAEFPMQKDAFEETADFILQTLVKKGIEKAVFVGYSMGARVALYFALHHPEKVEALIIESGTAGIADEAARQARIEHDENLAQQLERITNESAWQVFLHNWYAQPLWNSLQSKPMLLQTLFRREFIVPHSYAKSLRTMGTGTMPSLWHKLSQLSVPTLCIVGAFDQKFVEIGQNMAYQNPNIQLVQIEHAGHNVHLEAQSQFVKVIKVFLHKNLNPTN